MNYIVTDLQMKAAENAAVDRGLTLRALAENAAVACFDYIYTAVSEINDKSIAVLCGKGMNGGDGMLLSALLRRAGAQTLTVFVCDRPDAGLAGEIYRDISPTLITTDYSLNEEPVKHTLQEAHIIIDCVFGTGFYGDLSANIAELFEFINISCDGFKIAVDLPSDTFAPDVTLTLGAYKKTRHPLYNCVLLDIGLIDEDFDEYEAIMTESFILTEKPERFAASHKGTFGRLLNIAGNERYIGAALLSTKAAIKSGTGIVSLAASDAVINAIAAAVPEAVFIRCAEHSHERIKMLSREMKSADAIALGCGLGSTVDTRKVTEFVIRNAACPIILDADGINSISDNINILQAVPVSASPQIILTPHPAEFARLTGLTVDEIQSNRIDCAKLFAKESGAIIVLKGVNTVIASPNGEVRVNPTGNAGLAKAGTGDVLTGIIAGLAAQGLNTFNAAVLGVYLHGLSADNLALTMPLSRITASDVAENIP
jgi:NAD(P)H-hydrate epimerase